jgi:tetratricopeptide (TPR) repeat protein
VSTPSPVAAGSMVVQNITATAGFAYGVIGADLHVFGDGTPLYLLLEYQEPSAEDPALLLKLPSRMLNSHSAVVDFIGRDDERAEIKTWREEKTRIGVRWMHAPGGQGKTRLADQVARDSKDDGWKVVFAVYGSGSVLQPGASQDLRLDGVSGLLLIIDYADRWPLTHLTWLLSNALLHQTGVPTRVLLLARTAAGWPALRGALDNYRASTSQRFLGPLVDKAGGRDQVFAAARDAFATLYGIADPTVISVPDHVNDEATGRALTVHIAALVAVDAYARGQQPPADMSSFTSYLLDRERAHWTRMYESRLKGLDYQTPPGVMTRAVFTATLTGALSYSDGEQVLTQLGLGLPANRVLVDHAACYPPPGSAPDSVLEPLGPDRLAEDFLALTLPGHPADQPQQPWAAATATALLSGDLLPASTSRAVTFLSAAAHRWPELGEQYLFRLLLRNPKLAVAAGSAALTTLASIPNLDIAVLEAIEPILPGTSHVDLDVGAAAVAQRLTDHRLAATDDLTERARLYVSLSGRLTHAGRHQEALTASREAVTIYRLLAQTSPAMYEPRLARALVNLGAELSWVGQRKEALAPSEEAVDLYRRLAKLHPDTFLSSLATSSMNLGGRLAELGQRQQALGPTQESVVTHWHLVQRSLARSEPVDGEPGLASALTQYGARLADVGRHDEALTFAQMSVDLYRRLTKTNPAAHEPGFALALKELGARLGTVGRLEQALDSAQEAVTVHRHLAEANPAAYFPELAGSLNHLGMSLARLGRVKEALATGQESVVIRRQLAQANPDFYGPELAGSLNNLTGILLSLGRSEEALAQGRECVEIYRLLAKAHPTRFRPLLENALAGLVRVTAKVGHTTEALALTHEALAAHRELVAADPTTYLPHLAAAVTRFRLEFQAAGRDQEATTLDEEAVTHYRQLAAANPTTYLFQLASALERLLTQLDATGRADEALTARKETVATARQLAEADPASFLLRLAATLNDLVVRLDATGRADETLTVINESVNTFRQLVAADAATYLPHLAITLGRFGVGLDAAERRDEALAAMEEAVAHYRQLVAADAATYLPQLALTLESVVSQLDRAGRVDEALTARTESVTIVRQLADADQVTYLPQLAEVLRNLGGRLDAIGRREEALAPMKEAISLLRQLAAIDPASLPRLVGALTNFSQMLGEAGRTTEAQAIQSEAASLRSTTHKPLPRDES